MTPGIRVRGWLRTAFGVLAATTLAACAMPFSNPFSSKALDNFSLTYKISIQQGVVVTQEMADQLKVGMTRDQVRFVLGTPILTDPFHKDRWDYPFRFQPGRGPIEERRFAVYFQNDLMTGFNGDSLPTEEQFAASRNFATTRIARTPPLTRPLPQLPGNTPDLGGTSVTPGTNIAPNRSTTTPTDQTPLPPSVPTPD